MMSILEPLLYCPSAAKVYLFYQGFRDSPPFIAGQLAELALAHLQGDTRYVHPEGCLQPSDLNLGYPPLGEGIDPYGDYLEKGAFRQVLLTADGVKTDVSGYLASKPVVNKAGAWSTVLKAGRYISKKLIAEGVYAISVTDADYNSLASVPVGFYDAKKPREEWPAWAQVAAPE